MNRSLDLASPEVNGENILAFSDCNIMLLVSPLLFPFAMLSVSITVVLRLKQGKQ